MTLNDSEKRALGASAFGVAGCGGLGCYVIEYLLRLGVGAIIAADGDVFEQSNLNRQLYSAPDVLGKKKVLEARRRAAYLRPDCSFTAFDGFIDGENADAFVSGCDIVIDALDNPEARRTLAAACRAAGIPLVHGAVSGWSLQVAVIMPDSDAMESIYAGGSADAHAELAFLPPMCAAYETSEAVKLLCRPKQALRGRLLCIDLLENDRTIIEL